MASERAAERLFLEDIAIGQEFRSGEYHLDTEQIIAFASQFDPQPFHVDPEAARDSFFEGLAASGWHTMAITMRLVVRSVPFARGIIGAGGEIAWPSPTRPGDVLHVISTVLDITPSRSKPDRAIVLVRCLTFAQNDALRQQLTAKLLAFKRDR